MIKDYWIYQDQPVDPWALYLVMEYERGHKAAYEVVLDVTVYGEFIDNAAHSASALGIIGGSVSDLANGVIAEIVDSGGSVTSSDFEKVREGIIYMLAS